jgi:hypothetical protein
LRLRAAESIDLSAGCEKGLKQGRSFVGQNSRNHLHAMVELRVIEHRKTRADGSAFGVVCAIDQALDASLDHGTRAHGARFDGHVHGCVEESVIADFLGCRAKSNHLGMRGGITITDGAIARARNDTIADNQDAAHGDLAALSHQPSLFERRFHEDAIRFATCIHDVPE